MSEEMFEKIEIEVDLTKLECLCLEALFKAPARSVVLTHVREVCDASLSEDEILEAWDTACTKMSDAIMDAW